jgi:hypothetical protein
VRAVQLEKQADGVQAQGKHAKRRQQTSVGDAALRQAQTLVSGSAGIKEGGGEAGQQRVHKSV